MQNLRSYLTIEGLKQDLEETIKRHKESTKSVAILYTPLYNTYKAVVDEDDFFTGLKHNFFTRACMTTTTLFVNLMYYEIGKMALDKLQ